MPVFNIAKFCGTILAGLAFCASAHESPKHQHASAASELGTSAALDAQGRLWIATKEISGTGQYVVLQSSSDLGQTWSVPKRVQQTPEPVAANSENRPKLAFGIKGEMYVAYTKPFTKPYTGEIRFTRSLDGGRTFTPPMTVHANRDLITHGFESVIVDKNGLVYVTWIDKRDTAAATVRKEKYAGGALYYAVSDDSGASFKGDYKIADHTCECCRISLALNGEGKAIALWRHIFEPNARDHALAELTPDGTPTEIKRASFDDWRVDACPHHGPSLAYAADGTRHQTWFNIKGNEGGVFYASAPPSGALGTPLKLGSAQAEHADVAVHGKEVTLVWKQFDGKATAIIGKLSNDGGANWQDKVFASTQGASDQPHLLDTAAGVVLVWRTQNEGVRVLLVKSGT